MPWFLEQADQASLFDNSGTAPRPIGEKKDGVIYVEADALPQIVEAVQKIATE